MYLLGLEFARRQDMRKAGVFFVEEAASMPDDGERKELQSQIHNVHQHNIFFSISHVLTWCGIRQIPPGYEKTSSFLLV
jgi:hypothetical protein